MLKKLSPVLLMLLGYQSIQATQLHSKDDDLPPAENAEQADQDQDGKEHLDNADDGLDEE
jgi:predicted alpha/beta superfamily hydrolase